MIHGTLNMTANNTVENENPTGLQLKPWKVEVNLQSYLYTYSPHVTQIRLLEC